MAADFEKCKMEKIMDSLNLSNMARGILTQITGPGTCHSRSQTFAKTYEMMRTFVICYENGWFFHKSLVKAGKNCQSKQMKNLKLAVSTVRQMKLKSFLNFTFAMTART